MRFSFALIITLWAGQVHAQTIESNLALDGIKARIEYLSTDPAAHGFEIGMLQTLRAVEKTLQVRYEYGLGDQFTELPLLRLNAGEQGNPAAKPSTPGTLSAIIDGFVTDMAEARATLERAEVQGITPFELTLNDIWFDINANGTRESAEGAVTTLGAVILGERAYRDFSKSDRAEQPLTVRFDAADHAWLLAYTHMLSGFGNLFMAFDPTPVIRDLADRRAALADAPQIPYPYDLDALRAEITALMARKAEIPAQRKELMERIQRNIEERGQLRNRQSGTEDESLKAGLQMQYDQRIETFRRLVGERGTLKRELDLIPGQIRTAEAKLPESIGQTQRFMADNRDLIDIAYVLFTALAQQPDPARIRATNQHLKAMIANNRIFWARLAQETDNDREWIPNATQTSVLPLTIRPGVAEAWQNILKDIEAMLEGKLLITHPGLPAGYGLSLPAYVADPAPLDIVGWLHGVDAYRYAARGPRLTAQNWRAFQRLSGGNAGGFALFFN